ncbi:hypothetical protein VNI00_007898 [Paramarasmius palmivorus]|uniref:BZIP domain-containing protein n=1 Tax=Paramarasmius palmivorus TaxID=297713 RepID=A0AAW0CY81_9AGAR
MSSKRGRKRNDNLPPNRARDVQRAFRARRAAHLQALEQRVTELEEENSHLRQALNLPPANRPPLGKGPTGKDKPKLPDSISHGPLPPPISMTSRDSSDSPPSTRMSSHSPPGSMSTTSIGSRGPVQNVDDGAWEQTIMMSDSDLPSSSASSSYPLPPMSAPPPMSSKSIHYNPYPNSMSSAASSLPSSSRTMSSPMFLHSQTNHSYSDRSVGTSYGSPTFAMRGDVRDESRTHFSYSPSPYQSHDTIQPHHTPTAQAVAPGLAHSQSHPPPPREAPLPSYPHRRSLTEPQPPYSLNQGFPHLPPVHGNQSIRLPSPPRVPNQDGVPHPPHHLPPRNYGPDGRINSMS